MASKLWLITLLSLSLLSPAAAPAGSDIYVGGPYGTKITSLPYTISAPGSYYLGGNLSYAGGNGITVNADNVTLDLMGFTLSGSGNNNFGIYLHDRKNVEIRNGTVSSWNTGIYEDGTGMAHRVINIRAEGNIYGIWLKGSCHLIEGCLAAAASIPFNGKGFVLAHGTIHGCQAKNFPQSGIWVDLAGSIISGNVITNVSDGDGISALGPALITANAVLNCKTGIYCQAEASLIGNTVSNVSIDQTGIAAPAASVRPTLMDQNTVTGPGTHYTWGSGTVAWRNNAGFP
jgi:hypothetical protein